MGKQSILVTGAAGFIGFHLCERLLKQGHRVVGLDNVNDYYSVDLKYDRLKELGIQRQEAERFDTMVSSDIFGDQFQFIRLNLEDREALPKLFNSCQFDSVCNLLRMNGCVTADSNDIKFFTKLFGQKGSYITSRSGNQYTCHY